MLYPIYVNKNAILIHTLPWSTITLPVLYVTTVGELKVDLVEYPFCLRYTADNGKYTKCYR